MAPTAWMEPLEEGTVELGEIYRRGEQIARQEKYWRSFGAVESGFVPDHDRRVLDRYTFRQRCIDAVEADTACSALGVELSTPVIMSAITNPIPAIAENGLQKVAQGLKEAGSLMWLGTPLPELPQIKELADTGVPLAVNLKPLADRDQLHLLLERLQETAVRWIGIEVDAGEGTKVEDRVVSTANRSLSSVDLVEIRKRVTRPLLAKGVLSAVDAVKVLDAGFDGLVVSNHGAHTLDYLPHPLQVMEEIVGAVNGRAPIIVESGFRRGSDVLKGLAFGADLVGVGRPILFGLVADGQEGVRAVIESITAELRRIMTLVGAPTPARIPNNVLIRD